MSIAASAATIALGCLLSAFVAPSGPARAEGSGQIDRTYQSDTDSDSKAAEVEAGAAKGGDQAHVLYRQAAVWRERGAEYGQALLDYRAMLESAPPSIAAVLKERYADHMAYLTLLTGKKPKENADGPGESPNRTEAAGSANGVSKGMERPRDSILVPGGVDLLSKTVGMEASSLKGSDALERLFAFILKSDPALDGDLRNAPVRKRAVTYLREYLKLLEHLHKERLWPEGDKTDGTRTLTVTLAGSKTEQKAANRFLKFFGVKYKLRRRKDGSPEVLLGLKGGADNEARQRMLDNMGVNLHGALSREIQVAFSDARLPSLFDTAVWRDKILRNPQIDESRLLENMLLDRDAMRLYLALVQCSAPVRRAMLEGTAPGELMRSVGAVQRFGRFLDIREGRLAFPGSAKSWEAFLEASPGDGTGVLTGRLLRRDDGRALALYYFLRTAPESTRLHFTSSPQALSALYSLLPNPDSQNSRVYRDLGRLAGLIHADRRGLLLGLDPRSAMPATGRSAKSPVAPEDFPSILRLDEDGLSKLIERVNERKSFHFSLVEVLEFLSYVRSKGPSPFDTAGLAAMPDETAVIPIFIDLIWDLQPSPDLTARYLYYCRWIAVAHQRAVAAGAWNLNGTAPKPSISPEQIEAATRTSQALFYLLSGLRRRGVIDHEEGEALANRLLDALQNVNERVFVREVMAFLSQHLLPVLKERISTEDPSELLWQALAGGEDACGLTYEGASLRCDLHTWRLDRMRSAVQYQDYIPLTDLLELEGLLESADPAVVEKLLLLARKRDQLPRGPALAHPEQGDPGEAARADLNALAASWSAFMERRGSRHPPFSLKETAAALDLELGVTLLTYCYAFDASPEVDPLVYDPSLVRRHCFYPEVPATENGWMAARLSNDRRAGIFFEGCLSGLGEQLALFQAAKPSGGHSLGEEASPFATLTSALFGKGTGVRTDRAQEYVALAARLGREVVALSASKERLMPWCQKVMSGIMMPGRLDESLRLLKAGDPLGALGRLTPSELFLIGNAYLSAVLPGSKRGGSTEPDGTGNAGNEPPAAAGTQSQPVAAVFSPTLERLSEILPAEGTEAARRFQEEVADYGVFLHARLGLSTSSFAFIRPYGELTGWGRNDLLFERICDLKIQLAELGYSQGWPATFGDFAAEMALDDLRARAGEGGSNDWRRVLESISALSPADARRWIRQGLNLGYLTRVPREGSEQASPGADGRDVRRTKPAPDNRAYDEKKGLR